MADSPQLPSGNDPHPTDSIIGHGLLFTETLLQELRERLANRLARMRGRTETEILQAAREVLAEFEPLVAQALLETDLAAFVAGVNVVAGGLPLYTQNKFQKDLPFGGDWQPPSLYDKSIGDSGEPLIRFPIIDRAKDNLLERKILDWNTYHEVSADVRNRSFTVAGDMTEQTMEKIRTVLAENVESGASFQEFKAAMAEGLDKSFLGPSHAEVVWRTNIMSAYADGHETMASHPIVEELFPYQEILPILDSRCRPEHAALAKMGLSGTGVYNRSDPFWDFFTPPWGYSCRCGVLLCDVERAARKGVVEAQTWLRTGQPPANPEHRLQFIPFRPKDNFGGARRKARV
jgi:hypothetical protein